jgi:hypothetical protein
LEPCEVSDENNSADTYNRRVPLTLWPAVLARVNNQRWTTSETASVLYTLLKEGPAVVTVNKHHIYL